MGLGAAIGSIFGAGAGREDLDKARQYEDQGLGEWTSLGRSNLRSEMNQTQADPRFQQAQYSALDKFGQMGEGVTDADKARLTSAQNKIGTQEAGQRGAITSNYAARGGGQGGMSGPELTAQLVNQQGAADRGAGMGSDVVAAGGNRALAAYGQMSGAAGAGRSQDFGEQAARANANDTINQFNANYNMNRARGTSGAYGTAAGQRMGHYQNAVDTGAGIGDAIGGLGRNIPFVGGIL